MNQTQLDLTEGEHLKENGMALVSLYAEHQWQERFKAVARQVAAMGKPFTSEEIMGHIGEPPGHRNVIGATMNAIVRELKLKRIGYCKARRPSRHAAIVAIWQLL